MIAAIVPACNEEDKIGACLRSLLAASRCPQLLGEATLLVVALDACTDADGHRHIYGANLGVSADAYQRAGGFKLLASIEDVALVQALQASGASIAWSAAPRVLTSARRSFHAPDGFGATLQRVADEGSWHQAAATA